MRPIKFRAWDKERSEYLSGGHVLLVIPKGKGEKETTLYLDLFEGDSDRYKDRFVIEQFTGLHDKNGREIFEGDIVRVWIYQDEDEPELNESKVHKVIWCGDGYPAFDLEPAYAEESNSLSHIIAGADGETIEVIGNIHENPELLK